MRLTDLLLLDIKHIDPTEHKKLTGCPNGNILELFRYLSEIGKPVWIRYVLVPGITDGNETLRRTRDFIAALNNVEKIEVLPYHSMGEFKWNALGIPYTLEGVKPPDAQSTAYAERVLRGE